MHISNFAVQKLGLNYYRWLSGVDRQLNRKEMTGTN